MSRDNTVLDRAISSCAGLQSLPILIKQFDIDINEPDVNGEYPFDYCFTGSWMSAVALLRLGARPRSQPKSGNVSILHAATMFFQQGLDRRDSPKFVNWHSFRLMRELLRLLAPFGIDFATQADDSRTPIFFANDSELHHRKGVFGFLLITGLLTKAVAYRIMELLPFTDALDAFAIMCDTDVAQIGDTIPLSITSKVDLTDDYYESEEGDAVYLTQELKDKLGNAARACKFGYEECKHLDKELINKPLTDDDVYVIDWDREVFYL
jgi:hypothetical protein